MADKKDEGGHNDITNPHTFVGSWLEAKRQAERDRIADEVRADRPRGRTDPLRNVIGLSALAVGAFVWFDATRRGSDSALMSAFIAMIVSAGVFSLPVLRPIFAALVHVLTWVAWIGLILLAWSYGRHIGLFE